MLYRRVGKTGESASILGFGCMRLPTRGAKAHLIAEDKAQKEAAELTSKIIHLPPRGVTPVQ